MEIKRWDIRRALRVISDKYYEDLKDNKTENVSKREYFNNALYLFDDTFRVSTVGNLTIMYNTDEKNALRFLRNFMVWNLDMDLKFRVSYENGSTNLILFNNEINKDKFMEIMKFLFKELSILFP
jgi:hypothetical protein